MRTLFWIGGYMLLVIGLAGILVVLLPMATGCDRGGGTVRPVMIPPPTVLKTIALSPPLIGVTGSPNFWAECKAFKETGAQWTTAGILWSAVEPTPGNYDDSALAVIVQNMKDCNLRLALKVRTGQLAWATGGADANGAERPSLPPKDAAAYQAYENFIIYLATYLLANMEGDIRLAIENEAHAATWWNGTIDQYQQLLETAHAAIRHVDPSGARLKVVDFGVASMAYLPVIVQDIYNSEGADTAIAFCSRYATHRGTSCPTNESDLVAYLKASQPISDFVTTHLRNGDIYDIYELHFYEEWDLLPDVMTWIRDEMSRNGYAKPIEAWEIGYAWQASSPYDSTDHAQDLLRIMATAFGMEVERLTYLPYQAGANEEIWRGLYDPDGKPRPALTAFQTLLQKIGTATSMDVLSFFDPSIHGYRFHVSGGEVYLAWADRPTTIRLLINGLITQVDYQGTVKTVTDADHISVSAAPLFLIASVNN